MCCGDDRFRYLVVREEKDLPSSTRSCGDGKVNFGPPVAVMKLAGAEGLQRGGGVMPVVSMPYRGLSTWEDGFATSPGGKRRKLGSLLPGDESVTAAVASAVAGGAGLERCTWPLACTMGCAATWPESWLPSDRWTESR